MRINFEKIFYIILITFTIFILGVQIGIRHGLNLQIEDRMNQIWLASFCSLDKV